MKNLETDAIDSLLNRFSEGDELAKDAIIDVLIHRFQRTASRLLAQNPRVKRWEMTDDIVQLAAVRMCRASSGRSLSTKNLLLQLFNPEI